MIIALGSALALLLTKELFGPVAQFFYAKLVGMKVNAAKKEADEGGAIDTSTEDFAF